MRFAFAIELSRHPPAGLAARAADEPGLVRDQRPLAPQLVGLERAVPDPRPDGLLRILRKRHRLAPGLWIQLRPRPQRLVSNLRRDGPDGVEMILQFAQLIAEELELIVELLELAEQFARLGD